LRSIRLTQQLDDILRKDAEQIGISVNALINKILIKYKEWDRLVDRFGFISIASETFRSILEEVDDKKLENIAKNLGRYMPESITMFWFKEFNLETILKTLSLFSKYSGLQKTEVLMDERGVVITFHHDLGEKWSTFLKYFIAEYVKNAVKIPPKTEVVNNLVAIHLVRI
jgi:hypothetical protein